MRGIMTSETTRSGSQALATTKPSAPFFAVLTSYSSRRSESRYLRMSAVSSTTSTRGFSPLDSIDSGSQSASS